MPDWLLILIAALFLVLTPFAPQLLRLRIRFFRWIRWEWAAKLIEDHFTGWCWILRAVFLVIFVIATALLFRGWAH